MSRQQQQQQQQPQPQQTIAPTIEQILQFMAQQSEAITVLQQQILATQTTITTPSTPTTAPTPVAAPVIKAAPPPKFTGERSQVVGFILVCAPVIPHSQPNYV